MIGAPSVLVLGLGEGGSYLAQALAAATRAGLAIAAPSASPALLFRTSRLVKSLMVSSLFAPIYG